VLLDSNILIYACQPKHSRLRHFIREHAPSVSVITKVETLGYHDLSPQEKTALTTFFEAARVRILTSEITDRAMQLRQQRSLSLGDSLIAGTAMVHGLPLVTHNTGDFSWAEELELLDPMSEEEGE